MTTNINYLQFIISKTTLRRRRTKLTRFIIRWTINSGGSTSDNAKTSKAKKVHNSNNDEETATENSVKVADRKRLTYADMAKLGVAERAAGTSSDATTVVNDAATVNDAADNASAVPGEDKPRPAGSRPTSSASSRVSSRDVLKSS
ncbi:hypothetical protein Tsp_03926 [Trichinella spiralis]|uniref:hypothetical protein n=1 Tax=Trichinella spiralis TaxID=6334 RepID=UPI0001EFC700|nr:hypothetical protein Tsp_03926 [Trichinella spiralis]